MIHVGYFPKKFDAQGNQLYKELSILLDDTRMQALKVWSQELYRFDSATERYVRCEDEPGGWAVGQKVLVSAEVVEVRSNGVVVIRTDSGDFVGVGAASVRSGEPEKIRWHRFDACNSSTYPPRDGDYLIKIAQGMAKPRTSFDSYRAISEGKEHWRSTFDNFVMRWAEIPECLKEEEE